ncbi:MAG TPA: hypothetical protein VFK43_10125, partial [Acidimicrobiales bacterium]|nr:hypothetical protein [Acidimicrobiales bacterium]
MQGGAAGRGDVVAVGGLPPFHRRPIEPRPACRAIRAGRYRRGVFRRVLLVGVAALALLGTACADGDAGGT